MGIQKNVIESWKTTVTGLFLVIFSLIDLWHFKALDFEIVGVDVHAYSIAIGLLFIIMKDRIIDAIEKRLKG